MLPTDFTENGENEKKVCKAKIEGTKWRRLKIRRKICFQKVRDLKGIHVTEFTDLTENGAKEIKVCKA
jgi:hypothetical protein